MLGTINFVSELYKHHMLSRVILYSIFVNLLGLDESAWYPLSDHTVEAAVLIINKLGSRLEQETSSVTGEKKAELE